jgi:hypothetical protein
MLILQLSLFTTLLSKLNYQCAIYIFLSCLPVFTVVYSRYTDYGTCSLLVCYKVAHTHAHAHAHRIIISCRYESVNMV